MCDIDIKSCKHTKETSLFRLGFIVTILLLTLILIGSFFREELISSSKTEVIEKYKNENINFQDLNEEEILEKISDEDKDFIDALEFYYWPVVILLPPLFFFLVLYQIGKIYGDLRVNSIRLNKKQCPEVFQIFSELTLKLGFKKTEADGFTPTTTYPNLGD